MSYAVFVAFYITQKNENDALEFLRGRPAHQPFCLTVAFFATHAEDSNPLQFLPQPLHRKARGNKPTST